MRTCGIVDQPPPNYPRRRATLRGFKQSFADIFTSSRRRLSTLFDMRVNVFHWCRFITPYPMLSRSKPGVHRYTLPKDRACDEGIRGVGKTLLSSVRCCPSGRNSKGNLSGPVHSPLQIYLDDNATSPWNSGASTCRLTKRKDLRTVIEKFARVLLL